MPVPVPVPMLIPPNRLFASAGMDEPHPNTFVINTTRLPSTYYMDANGAFIRLRPLHSSGFAIFQRPTRNIGIYAGQWNSRETYATNVGNAVGAGGGGTIVFRSFGASAAATRTAIADIMQNHQITTQQLNDQNAANPRPALANDVRYVTDGALAGTIFGGDAVVTNNYYWPMKVVDATTVNSGAHTGHPFITNEAGVAFYEDNFPGLLPKLMQLGQLPQSFDIGLPSIGRTITMPIDTDTEYFPRTMFPGDRAQAEQAQSEFIRTMIMSFV